MPFIGIIAKESESNFIRNEILKNSENIKFEIININQKNIENIKNIKFDILVINENIDEFFKKSNYLEYIINKSNYIIVNSDIKNNLECNKLKGVEVITYGFNSKSSITVSSVKEENLMLCIQRNFKSVKGKTIEEQEINIKIEKNNIKKTYNVLVIFTILRIYGKNLKKI